MANAAIPAAWLQPLVLAPRGVHFGLGGAGSVLHVKLWTIVPVWRVCRQGVRAVGNSRLLHTWAMNGDEQNQVDISPPIAYSVVTNIPASALFFV